MWRARETVIGEAARALRSFGGAVLCAFIVVAAGAQTQAPPGTSQQNPPPPPPPPESIVIPGAPAPAKPASKSSKNALRVDVDLALVNVTVTDPYNRLVTGLEQENFRVFEDNTEQEITHFSAEDVPVSIGVILDLSGSMANKIDKSRMAALQFFKTANPQDEFFVVSFNEHAELSSPFTTSVEDIETHLMFTAARGRTALLDGLYLGLSQMRGARNQKKALLLISDGGDNHSRYSEHDIRSFVREADTQIYAIGLYDPAMSRATIEEVNGPALLNEVTDDSGGRTFVVGNLNDLPDIAIKIGMELRNQYVLGYRPANHARDGKWRKIKVKLRPPKGLPPLNVYAKSGYYSPQ
jgi:Ca-activated chloride channel homolog